MTLPKKITSFQLSASLFLVAVMLAFSFSVISAQENTMEFPVTINGVECNSKAECKLLCDDPVNQGACRALAVQSVPKINFEDPIFLQDASQTLGCTTKQTCQALCSLPINFDKCSSFAKKYKLPGGFEKRAVALKELLEGEDNAEQTDAVFSDEELAQIEALKEEIAKEDLTLKEYCALEEHQVACTNIAIKFGLRGGLRLAGPGNCQTADSCRKYCDDPAHFSECKTFEVAGLNGCSSELACYNEAQAHPELLTSLVQNELEPATDDSSSQLNTDQIAEACKGSVASYEGKSASELAQDFQKSGVCQVLPQSGIPGQNNNCEAYLESDQPFSPGIFEKICSITAVNPGSDLPVVTDFEDPQNLDSYSSWCTQLPSVGQAASDWQVVPQLCNSFVSTFKEARQSCDLPAEQRPSWLSDDVALSSFCLSAPSNLGDYAQSCAADSANCESGGYDWYCTQAGKSCVPLYQGTPIDRAIGSFSDAGLIKDGSTVTVVLNETTKEFAENVLAQSVGQTVEGGATVKVVSEVPQTLSSSAVFAAGVGTRRGSGNQAPSQTFFSRPIGNIERPQSETSTQTSQQLVREAFEQPWYAIDAKIPVSDSKGAIISPIQRVSPATQLQNPGQQNQAQGGWQVIRANEQKFTNQQPVNLPVISGQPQRIDQSVPVRPIDSNLLKPQIINPNGIAPVPGTQTSPNQPRLNPTVRPENSGAGTNTGVYRSPTPYNPPTQTNSGSSTGGTGTSVQTAPTEPTKAPETQPNTYQQPADTYVPPPTQPPTTQTSTTTTTGSSAGSGTTTTTTTGGSTSPGVQGVHTEEDIWDLVFSKWNEFFSS